MKKKAHVLALDIGTSSLKAAVFDKNYRMLTTATTTNKLWPSQVI